MHNAAVDVQVRFRGVGVVYTDCVLVFIIHCYVL
jgi:hypothetical protein